jgi:predicted phage baseplate assembly protein
VKNISQLQAALGGIEEVFNPAPAEGGADAETLNALGLRGPFAVRSRGRALNAVDFETLAREASAAVAVARTVPCRDGADGTAPGWVTLVIVPESRAPRPFPSFGLRERVRKYIQARASANLVEAERIRVVGPTYLPIDLEALVAVVNTADAGTVEALARAALEDFFDPLRGGPERRGWELGRDVFLSDVAVVLERTQGIDYVKELTLLRNGVSQGDRVQVADEYIVVAGEIRLKLVEEHDATGVT